jgi:hypothetical protein
MTDELIRLSCPDCGAHEGTCPGIVRQKKYCEWYPWEQEQEVKEVVNWPTSNISMEGDHTFICGSCHVIKSKENMVTRDMEHRPPGVTVRITACSECAEMSDCTSSTGNHGMMLCFDDIPGWEARSICPPELASVPGHQKAACAICKLWMVWSVERMSWVDPIEPHIEGEPGLPLDEIHGVVSDFNVEGFLIDRGLHDQWPFITVEHGENGRDRGIVGDEGLTTV